MFQSEMFESRSNTMYFCHGWHSATLVSLVSFCHRMYNCYFSEANRDLLPRSNLIYTVKYISQESWMLRCGALFTRRGFCYIAKRKFSRITPLPHGSSMEFKASLPFSRRSFQFSNCEELFYLPCWCKVISLANVEMKAEAACLANIIA